MSALLTIQDLSKTFGDVRALAGCSLAVERGTILGFLGPNGAGKTTAMRSIFGLVKPDSGTVSWDGREISSGERLGFGYMPEQRGLYPKMRVKDQLVYFARLHGMDGSRAAAAADSWLERFGLADRSGDTLESLSHGNQQRVQLAVALVHEPELLVLDEPFSGLDPLAVETMSEILREQAEAGRAVLFSSHQLDLVEDLCEQVSIIHQGRVVLDGTVSTLKSAAPVRHLEIELETGDRPDIDYIPGVSMLRSTNGVHVFVVDKETDIRTVLAGAEASGSLKHFSYTPPALSDLFREAVS